MVFVEMVQISWIVVVFVFESRRFGAFSCGSDENVHGRDARSCLVFSHERPSFRGSC